MNDIPKKPNNLHWSVDYAYHHSSNSDYQRQLLLLLEKSLCDSNIRRHVSEKKHHYTILPNFWNGYQPSFPDQGIGQTTVHRNQGNQFIWHYNIHYKNITNGEEMRFDFRTQTNLQPTVIDKWYVHVKSQADGIYDQFGCTVEITDNGYWKQVSLEMETGLVVSVGKVSSSSSVVYDWMLFDWVSKLEQEFAYQAELELYRKQLWEQEEKLNRYPLSHHRSQETISSWRNTLQQASAEESLVNHL